ncbi:MAG: alpha-L-fucosidase [Verrucomicrobiota bacterium]
MNPTSRLHTLTLMAMATLATCCLPARADLAALQQAYVNQNYGMFLHFNMGTYTGIQWSAWNLSPDTFTVVTSAANPTGSIKVATDQWATTAKAAGMTYGVLTTKHHDGFELWDTAVVNSSGLSNHDIAATTWYNNPASPNYHVDVVKAYADSFRAQGLKVGLYYSIWDRNAGVGIDGPYDRGDSGPAEMGHPVATTAYVKAQLLELLTNYGAIDVLWTDGWPWQTNGYENKVDYTEVYNYIKQISPDTLLLDNSVLHTMVGTDIVAYEGARPPSGNILPSEMAGTISADGSWFYTSAGATTLKSAATLASDITFCNANHCTYLLNVPPGQDGMIQSNMVQRLADVQAVQAPGYTLTYDANGGTGSQSDSSSPYASGTTVTVLGAATIAKPGYTFTGWNTVAIGGGTSYAPAATFSITANTTLYAQWSSNTSTTVINVQYGPINNENGQSGNASMAGLTGPSADTGTTWNSFLGTRGGNAYNGAQATDAALVDSTGKPTPVELTFLAGDGYAKPGTGTVPIFRSAVFSAGNPIDFVISGLPTGAACDLYALSGGSPSATYAGTFHVTGTTVSASQSSANTGPFNAFNSGNTLLFSNLAPTVGGKLTLTLEGGSYRTSNGFQLVVHVTNSSKTLTYAANAGIGAQSDSSSPYVSGTTVTVLGAGSIARTGYTFTGWNTVAIGGGTPYAQGATFSITANTTLYAQWLINTYTTWALDNHVTGGEIAVGPDGISNLLLYALTLKLNGTNGSAGTLTGRLLSFNKRTAAVANGDVTYTIETSTTLRDANTPGDGGWTPVTPDTNNASIISYTLPSVGKIFARLRVSTIP